MVFLRPVVVRDAAQSDELSLDRYELMRIKQENAQPKESVLVPINTAPVLPVLQMPPRVPGAVVTPVPPPLIAPPVNMPAR